MLSSSSKYQVLFQTPASSTSALPCAKDDPVELCRRRLQIASNKSASSRQFKGLPHWYVLCFKHQ